MNKDCSVLKITSCSEWESSSLPNETRNSASWEVLNNLVPNISGGKNFAVSDLMNTPLINKIYEI